MTKYEDEIFCIECGINITYWLKKDKRRSGYRLENNDYVCSLRCFKKYSLRYFRVSKLLNSNFKDKHHG